MRNLWTAGLRQGLDRFADDRRGVVAIVTAMLMVPLVLAIGVAVDASRMFLVRAELSQAVDAAALAAGQAIDAAAVTADARRIFKINYPAAYLGSVPDLPEVNYDEDTGRVEVIARASMPTTLMQLAHVDNLDIEARALVVREQAGLELALVLGTTGSMASPASKLTALKQAANDLVDIIYGPADTGEDLYVSVVPFSARVKIGTSRAAWLSAREPGGWDGCVEQRSGDEAFDDAPLSVQKFPPTHAVDLLDGKGKKAGTVTPSCPSAEILPLTASKTTVKNRIGSLTATGNTRIDVGTGWGWRVISERWRGSWGAAGLPFDDEEKTAKAIVIMTDGKNEPDDGDEKSTAAEADANLTAICTAMKAAGYLVFTVAFEAPGAVAPTLRGCASSPAHFFSSPTAADLNRAFRQIAGRLSTLRLAE